MTGLIIFPVLLAVMLPKWLSKGSALPFDQRRIWRRLIRLAAWDALRGNLSRGHAEIIARAKGEWAGQV